MTISKVNIDAIHQVRCALQIFKSAAFAIPKKWYYAPFISYLKQNIQPFHPRREGLAGTETIFRHTIKDMVVLYCFLDNMPDKIKIDEITFPPRDAADPSATLKRIVEKSRSDLGLLTMASQPRIVRMLDVFVLYHDICKRTGDRRDHEVKGAELFLSAKGFFSSLLTDREFQIIYLLIKYHGAYGQIAAARKKGLPLPNYDDFIIKMNESGFSSAEKEFTIKALFLFNIVEGLQSDVFSADFYSTDIFEDILRNYEMVGENTTIYK